MTYKFILLKVALNKKKRRNINIISLFICMLMVIFLIQSFLFTNFSCATVAYSKFNSENLECILNYRGQSWLIRGCDYQSNSDNFLIDRSLKKWGRDGNWKNAVFAIEKIINMGFDSSFAFDFVFNGIINEIDYIINSISQDPKDASIEFLPNFPQKFFIGEHSVGVSIDKEALLNEILRQYKLSPKIIIELSTLQVMPKYTKEDLKLATSLISRFSTDYSSSSEERKSNVRLALSKFNKMRIEPNQTVSFNKTTGRRTSSGGYKEAHVIVDELFVNGVGGGVCQSSTTLYNALLLADNVQVVSSSRHSMPVHYIQLGFDAMVAYGTSDLVFKNIGRLPVFIHTYSNENRVFVDIYGENTSGCLIKKRRTEVIKKLAPLKDKIIDDVDNKYFSNDSSDNSLRIKSSQEGYEVQTYIDYYDNDILVESKKVRHTTYPAQAGVVVMKKQNLKITNLINDAIKKAEN